MFVIKKKNFHRILNQRVTIYVCIMLFLVCITQIYLLNYSRIRWSQTNSEDCLHIRVPMVAEMTGCSLSFPGHS